MDIDVHYNGAKYKLVNFKLKTPSEHTINGQRFAMEQQFMHTLVQEEAKEGDVKGQEEEKILPKTLMVSVMFSSDPLSSANYVEK